LIHLDEHRYMSLGQRGALEDLDVN
jgi:hypothetical protein